jgi:putative transposase
VAASRAWATIERFYADCRAKRPGKKGYPRFQRDCRSEEDQQTGWNLDAQTKHLALTDGFGMGPKKLMGTRDLVTFQLEPIKLEQITRIRLVRWADGDYAQFVLQLERCVEHVPTGSALGVDAGIASYLTDSAGNTVANPRLMRPAEARLRHDECVLSRRSLRQKRRKKSKANHVARQRARRNKYPATAPKQPVAAIPPLAPPASPAPQPCQSANWGKAKRRVGRAYLHLRRQREDFARKTASALVSSHDLVALEDLLARNLARTRRLAKAISDVGWSRFRCWLEYYGQLHRVPVMAIPLRYISQDWSACGKRVRKSLSVRTHVCPQCGLLLDRDRNAAVNILAWGLALAKAQGQCPANGAEGRSETERLGTVGLLRWVARPAVAPAGCSKNLPHFCGGVSIAALESLFVGVPLFLAFCTTLEDGDARHEHRFTP